MGSRSPLPFDGLTHKVAAGRVPVMAVFAVPAYLEQTAARAPAVREWIGLLPQIVAGLASRWSLSVGEPFQPGGQCSWTAPATDASGADLVLKVAFRFEGGEERRGSRTKGLGGEWRRAAARRL